VKITPTELPEVLLLEPKVHGDARGFFMESYNERAFNDAVGYEVRFVQDNHSRSSKGVLRGLHYQLPPHAQGKLVRVASGSVFDVAVDMRRSSPRFGKWVGFELSAENHRQLWIPPGFAHGFYAATQAELVYLCSDYYVREHERSLLWSDPTVAVHWPLSPGEAPILSEKDAAAPMLERADLFA